MKKSLSLMLSLVLVLGLGTAYSTQQAPTEVLVFAAASMTETLTALIEQYRQVAPEVSIVATFDSSGTLKTQIENGAPCDLFISAAQKQMNQLDIQSDEAANPARLDFVLAGSRVDLLENRVVLVVPEGNPEGIESFEDIPKASLMAIGNADVPVGSYSLEILSSLKLDEAELAGAGRLTYGSNVKEVVTQVKEGAVACGIVYATDARSAGLQVVDQATPQMCSQVIYPAAVITSGSQPEAAQAFLDYLRSDAAEPVFSEVGFSLLGQGQ